MSSIPIDKPLRASGLRRAVTGEDAGPVFLYYRGKALAVQAVQVPNECDEMMVVVLRGFAATLWARFPGMTLEQVRIALCTYSEQIDATDAEVTQASKQLELVNER